MEVHLPTQLDSRQQELLAEFQQIEDIKLGTVTSKYAPKYEEAVEAAEKRLNASKENRATS